jgi:3D (Asp-Asp-Asp) domain-containing protein
MIAAPRCYPFGAVFIIKGKEYIVQDRGGAITADKFYHDGQLVYGRVDIFFESHQDALEWGVQYLPVEVK